jgi:hypothetical protein
MTLSTSCSDLPLDFHFGACDFPLKIPFKKCFKIVFFFTLAPRSGFGAAISHAVARNSIVFCDSISRYRIVMLASRSLGAAAACVILLSFEAEDCKSYSSGCIQVAIVICQQIFEILAIVIFLLKILLKIAVKSSFCRFGVETRFWSCNFRRLCASFVVQSSTGTCFVCASFVVQSSTGKCFAQALVQSSAGTYFVHSLGVQSSPGTYFVQAL